MGTTKKIIAICQSGGEFVSNKDDGSLYYAGGEAYALDLDQHTQLKDFKHELAETFQCCVDGMTIKYFLPGNRKTLISISKDKDLHSMVNFFKESDQVEVFVFAAAPHVFNLPASSDYSGVTQKHTKIVEEKRIKWLAMKERITELVSNVNISNIREITTEILKEDLFEGRSVFCQEIMKSQMNYPNATNVFAALVAIINSNFPNVGLLLVKRVVSNLKDEYNYDGTRCDHKKKLRALSKFLAHLVNQLVVYALLANDVCLFLMGNPSSDNVEVAVKFCIECGSTFQEFLPVKFSNVLQEFDRVLHEVEIETSVRFLISMLFKIQIHRFRDFPGMSDELNLVHIKDQKIHHVSMLHDSLDPECSADDFEVDPHDFCDIDDSSDSSFDEEVSSQNLRLPLD